MPDDLPDDLALIAALDQAGDLPLEDIERLRDAIRRRAQRYGMWDKVLTEAIAEHEDYKAEKEARRRRAAFRVIKGGALGTLVVWLGKKLGHLVQTHKVAAAGVAVAVAGGARVLLRRVPGRATR